MCGLVSVIGNISLKEQSLFKAMLLADVVRGVHSTGVISTGRFGMSVFKKAMPSYDFLELPKADAVIDSATEVLIGHNRAATIGSKTTSNAHPFVHGDIALVHNGTLTNKVYLPNSRSFDTDSETIAYMMSSCTTDEERVQVIEKLEGAYALIWSDGTKVFLASNGERDLHWFRVRWMKTSDPLLVMCSEKAMGEWLIGRAGYTIEKHAPVPVNKLIEINPDTLEYQSQDFTPKKTSTWGGYAGAGSTWSGQGTTVSYITKDKYIDFIIDEIVNPNLFRGSSIDGKYDVEVYGSAQNRAKFDEHGMYRGKVHTITNKNLVRFRPHSVYECIVPDEDDVKLPESSNEMCGWCDTAVTDADIQNNLAVKYSTGYLHDDCWKLFNKELG